MNHLVRKVSNSFKIFFLTQFLSHSPQKKSNIKDRETLQRETVKIKKNAAKANIRIYFSS